MSVPISGGSVVVKGVSLEQATAIALDRAIDKYATTVSRDGSLVALAFSGEADRAAWITAMLAADLGERDFVVFDAVAEAVGDAPWLEIGPLEAAARAVWLRGTERGLLAPAQPTVRPPYARHEILSRSESGLHFVRERKSGILRQLTDDELHDFNDPAPCAECGEQFGCDHFNCAGEPLLSEGEIAMEVPPEWSEFAREAGISREDLDRLRSIRRAEGEYRLADGASADMRTQELVLLLNDSL